MPNYFALEDAIKQRLTGIDGIVDIYTPFSVEDMLQGNIVSPSLSIIYVDDRVSDSAGNGKASAVYQQWLVVLCVSEAGSQLEDTSQIRRDASPYIAEILKRLQGFDPEIQGFRPLKRATAGVSPMSSSTLQWFPFLFESQLLGNYT